MSEVLKFDKNGQWNLDKAQIIDMKSRKTLANLPSQKTPKVSQAYSGPSASEDPEKPMSPARLAGFSISPGSKEHEANLHNQENPKPNKFARHKLTKCEELLDQMIEVLEKSVYNAGTHPPKGYVPGKKQAKDVHAEYDPKYSFKDNRELVRMHHQDHVIPVKSEAHLDSLTRAAAKRGGHTIKE